MDLDRTPAQTTSTAPVGDEDCDRCEGTGLDPDAYFKTGDTWTHAPCSECQPEDDETAALRVHGPTDGGAQDWRDDMDDDPLMDGMGEELRQLHGDGQA